MTRLISAILARNEGGADRYLHRVITRCHEFSDRVLVLDDHSTDNTRQVAQDADATVIKRRGGDGGWWGVAAEAGARAELWTLAAERAEGGWVLICDADMLLHGDPRPLIQSWDMTMWAWPLVDLWDSEQTYRVDGPWAVGPTTPRPWLFRPSALVEPPQWPVRGIHCGHAPLNFLGPCGIAPVDTYWLHLGWLTKEHRVTKHAQYMAVTEQLSDFERAHAATILD